MSLLLLIGVSAALHMQGSGPAVKAKLLDVTLSVQGMTCVKCAEKVKSTLDHEKSFRELTLRFEPSVARFKIDPQNESIQDLIKGVRKAGDQYDARLMLQSDFDDDKLSDALRKVDGVRSAGMNNSKNIRLMTFHMDKKTYFADLEKAAASIGAKISSPTFEKEKTGS